MRRVVYVITVTLVLVLSWTTLSSATAIPPAPTGATYIVDQADVLSDAQEAELNTILRQYEERTSTEIAILIVDTIEDNYIENYSLNVARQWGIGQEGKNNGALLLAAIDDRQLRIEVGTGLEGNLSDIRSSQIIRNRITPQFAQGNYYQGFKDGIDGMILAIDAADDPQSTGQAPCLVVASGGGPVELSEECLAEEWAPCSEGQMVYSYPQL